MKKFIFPALVALCVSCGEAKKETTEEVAKKPILKCDSVVEEVNDTVAGTVTYTKVWKCDSNYIEGPAK